MKLLDTIQNNLRLYQGMTQAKVSYDFLKTQKEEDLLRLSEQINQMDASKIRRQRQLRAPARRPDQGNSRLCGGMYAADKR